MTTINTNSTNRSYTISGLTNDVAYRVRVAAINAIGTGPFTSYVTGTPSAIAIDPYYYDNTLLMHFDDRTGTYDPYGDYVSLLMHMDGANDSTTFVDSSLYNRNITVNGPAKLSSSQSMFGGTSAVFNADTSYLRVASGPDFAFPSDFTIECWVYFTNSSRGYQGIIGAHNGNDQTGWVLYLENNNNLTFQTSAGSSWGGSISSGETVTPDVWHHIAVSRSGSSLRIFVDGTLKATATNSVNVASASYIDIGDYTCLNQSGYNFTMSGYIDDLRITKGLARYTSNFSIPTEAFPTISPLFVDSSAYNNSLSISSTSISSSSSKFGGYAGYFNGSSSVRSAGTDIWQLGTNDFTIESWFNPSLLTNSRTIAGTYDGSNGGWRLMVGSPVGGTPSYGPQVDFTATNYGTEVDVIIPGVLEITRNNNQGIYNSAIEGGFDRYSSPANTVWNRDSWANVCNFSTRSYGIWREYAAQYNPPYMVNAELIMKHVPTNRYWLIKFTNWQGGAQGGAFAYTRKEILGCVTDSSVVEFRNGDSSVITKNTATPITTGEWHHIAAVRSSGSLSLYLDGQQLGSSNSFTSNITRNNSYGLSIGAYTLSNGSSSDYFNGYLDDLRITKGVPRYLESFVSPISSFPNNGPAPTVPSEPLSLAVSEDQGIVSLSWNRPLVPKIIDNRAPISYYGVEYSSNAGSSWTEHSVSSNDQILLTRNISGLPDNTPYSFRVRAQNSIGFGSYSNTSQIVVPQVSPTNINAISDDSQAYVSWDAPLADNYYSNVSLLLKADSSPIVDSSSAPKTVSVVNVPVSSTQSKFGASSLYLSPSNVSSYLMFSQSNSLNFGAGDFTIEFWIYPNSTNGIRRWVNCEKANGLSIRSGGSGGLEIYALDSSNNYSFINNSSATVGEWQHIAVVRYNGTVYAYKNGTYIGSNGNISYAIDMNGFMLGGSGGEMPDCYIDDFRITKGVARYTSTTNNFTAPTTSFLAYGPNSSSIRDYSVQYSSDAGSSWTAFSHSPSTNTLINVTGLNNGSNYVFRVAAVNLAGTGVYSTYSTGNIGGGGGGGSGGSSIPVGGGGGSSSINVAPRTDNLYNKTRILLHLDSN